jgi:hypothetical protein
MLPVMTTNWMELSTVIDKANNRRVDSFKIWLEREKSPFSSPARVEK